MESTNLLTINDVSTMYQVKKSWVRTAVLCRKIPYLKLGKHVRFCKEDLTTWFEAQKITPKYFSSREDVCKK